MSDSPSPAPTAPLITSLVELMDSQVDGLVVLTSQDYVLYANPAAERMFGVAPGGLVGTSIALPAAGPAEIALPGLEGGVAEVRLSALPWEGQPARLAALRDVTAQRRAERDLRESEALHRLILSSISDAVFITDDDGRFTYICPNAGVLFGHSPEEIAALGTFQRLTGLPPTDPAALSAAGELANQEHNVRDRAGREHVVLVTAKRVAIGGGTVLYTCRDITERHQAEVALRLTESRFRAVIENSADAVALLSPQGRCLYASPGTRHVLGLAPEALVGRIAIGLVHPDDRAHVLELWQEVIQAPGLTVDGNFRMRHGSGAWVWVEGTSQNQLHLPGVEAIVSNYRGLSQRKRAEARTRTFAQLGERLSAARTVEEAARVVFSAADQFVGWDAGWFDLYVAAEDARCGVITVDTFDGQRREVLRADNEIRPGPLTRKVIAEGPQLILRRPDEVASGGPRRFGNTERLSASLMLVPIRYRDEVRAVLSIQSYSYDAYTPGDLETLQALADHCGGALDRLQAEAALRANEERFRALIENSSDAIALIDAAGIVTFTSPSTAAVVGFTSQELLGRPVTRLVHGDSRRAMRAALAQLLQTPRGRVRGEFRYRRRDGAWHWIEAIVTNLLDVPSVHALVANYRDVTDRKQAEAEVVRHNQELLLLNRLGRLLSQLARPAEILTRLHELLGSLFDNRNFYIALYDAERQTISFPVYTIDGRPYQAQERRLGNGITEHVLRTRAPLLLNDDFEQTLAALGVTPVGRPARSLLAVPLVAGEVVLGVLCLQDYDRAGVYGEHERDLLATVALQAAVALENARLYAAAEQELAERRRTEAALRSSEALLRQVLEVLPVGVWLHDLNDDIVMGNPAGRLIWAGPLPTTLNELRERGQRNDYKAWWVSTGQRVAPDEWASARALARGEISIDEEIEIESFDGQHKIILNSAVPLKDEQGAITGVIVVNQDVTERRQHQRQLEAQASLSAALRHAVNRSEMLPIILDQCLQQLRAAGAAIARVLPGGQEAVVELAHGRWAATTGTRLSLVNSLAGRVLLRGETVITGNAVAEPDYTRPDLLSQPHALVMMPLIAEAQTVGAIGVARWQPYQPGEVSLLTALADLAANALHRASLHEQTQRRAEQLAAINALGRALTETLELTQIYEQLWSATSQLLPDISSLVISLFDAETDQITAAFGYHQGERIDPRQLPPVPLEQPGQGTQSEAIHTRAPVIIDDLPAYLQHLKQVVYFGDEMPVTQSALYVPMLVKSRVIGVVQVQSFTPSRFTAADAELLQLAANTAAIAIENARLFGETERRLRYVQALHDIDRAITSSLDLRVTLNVLLDQATTQLQVDAAAVLLLNPYLQTLDYAAGRGFRTKAIERTHLRLGEGLAGRAALERRAVWIPDLTGFEGDFSRRQALAGEGFTAYYTLPLIAKGEVKGVLDVFHRSAFNPAPEWLDFLQTLAGQAAIAVDNAAMFNSLQRSNIELSLAYDATIEGWSRALDLRDKETEGHTQRVTALTERLARRMGLNEVELMHARRGALLHDIGKMGIPDRILLKPGPLTEDEWVVMRQHPVYAYELLTPIAYLRPALDIPYCHHEKWDGTGYPRQLTGEAIPLAARIFAVADVWDALNSDRPYRSAWPAERVAEYIAAQSGQHFDPQVVAVFVELVEDLS